MTIDEAKELQKKRQEAAILATRDKLNAPLTSEQISIFTDGFKTGLETMADQCQSTITDLELRVARLTAANNEFAQTIERIVEPI